MDDLDRAIRAVLLDCLELRAHEQLLVVCDAGTKELAERIRNAGEAAGAEAVLALMAERASHGSEPPEVVAAAMARADVVVAPCVKSLSHTVARTAACDAGARVASMPGVTAEMLARVMGADMELLRRRCNAIAAALTEASEARITCPNGSDLRLVLEGRDGLVDTGELGEPGAFGNLPCGEGFIAPMEGTADGRLLADGTVAGYGLPPEPVELAVEGGRLVEATGEAGEWLMAQLNAAGPEGTNVAELGVGANEKAILTGELLEDEKILGSVHVAFGASAAIGGTIQVPVHIDCVVTRPDLALDDEPLLRAGELLL